MDGISLWTHSRPFIDVLFVHLIHYDTAGYGMLGRWINQGCVQRLKCRKKKQTEINERKQRKLKKIKKKKTFFHSSFLRNTEFVKSVVSPKIKPPYDLDNMILATRCEAVVRVKAEDQTFK